MKPCPADNTGSHCCCCSADTHTHTRIKHTLLSNQSQSIQMISFYWHVDPQCSFINMRCQTLCVCVIFRTLKLRVWQTSIMNICSRLLGDRATWSPRSQDNERQAGRSAQGCQDPLFSTPKKVIHRYPTHNNGVGATTGLSSRVLRSLLRCINTRFWISITHS